MVKRFLHSRKAVFVRRTNVEIHCKMFIKTHNWMYDGWGHATATRVVQQTTLPNVL